MDAKPGGNVRCIYLFGGNCIMTHVFVLTNHKGGVGKSTSATNIAVGLASVLRRANAANPRVLLIDTDSQGHASLVTTGRNDFGVDDSLYTVLMAERQDAPQTLVNCITPSTWDDNLHVLPASPLLEGAERELMGVAGAPYRLADPLSRILNRYAAVVIDTRPSFSLLTEMGLLAATDAIVPVEPRYLETVGLISVINKINDIREGWRHPNLHIRGILITKLDKRVKGHRQLLGEIKNHAVLGKLLCGVIPANEAISYSHHNHQSIFDYDPQASASRAYAQLVNTLIQSMYQKRGA
jgi:chromosome partitioning protein